MFYLLKHLLYYCQFFSHLVKVLQLHFLKLIKDAKDLAIIAKYPYEIKYYGMRRHVLSQKKPRRAKNWRAGANLSGLGPGEIQCVMQ